MLVRREAGERPQIPEVETPPKPTKDTRPTAADEKPNVAFILADDRRVAIVCRNEDDDGTWKRRWLEHGFGLGSVTDST